MNKRKFLLFLITCNALLIIGCLYKLINHFDNGKLILLVAVLLSLINAVISLKNSGKKEKIGFWKHNIK